MPRSGWHAPTGFEAVRVLGAGLFLIVGYVVKGKNAAFDAVPDRWDWLLESAVQIAVKAAEQDDPLTSYLDLRACHASPPAEGGSAGK